MKNGRVVIFAVKTLSCGKACGFDEVVTHILKLTGIHSILLHMLNNNYLSKKLSAEWLISRLVPAHK
jgi:glutaredoxin-related protein